MTGLSVNTFSVSWNIYGDLTLKTNSTTFELQIAQNIGFQVLKMWTVSLPIGSMITTTHVPRLVLSPEQFFHMRNCRATGTMNFPAWQLIYSFKDKTFESFITEFMEIPDKKDSFIPVAETQTYLACKILNFQIMVIRTSFNIWGIARLLSLSSCCGNCLYAYSNKYLTTEKESLVSFVSLTVRREINYLAVLTGLRWPISLD